MLKEIIVTIILFSAAPSFAKEWLMQLLNDGGQEIMVFQPQLIHAQLDDSVTFVAIHSGHNVQSYVVPEGDKQYKSALDQPIQQIILP